MSMEELTREGRGMSAGLAEAATELYAHKEDILTVLDSTLQTAYGASDIAYAYTADKVNDVRQRAVTLFAGGGEDAETVMLMVNRAADQTAQLPGLQEAAREAIRAARDAIFRLGAATLEAASSAEAGSKVIDAYVAKRTGSPQ